MTPPCSRQRQPSRGPPCSWIFPGRLFLPLTRRESPPGRPVPGAGTPHQAAPLGAGLAFCGPRPCSGSLHPPQAAVACAAIPVRKHKNNPPAVGRGLDPAALPAAPTFPRVALFMFFPGRTLLPLTRRESPPGRPVPGAGTPHQAAPLGAGLAFCGPRPCSGSLYPPQAAVACAAIPVRKHKNNPPAVGRGLDPAVLPAAPTFPRVALFRGFPAKWLLPLTRRESPPG